MKDVSKNITHAVAPVNINEAAKFLHLLDPTETQWTFQTFTDCKPTSYPDPLARILTGTLDQHKAELILLNQQGAGVFVTVNKTDGHGRKKSNIVGVRAWWQEADQPGVNDIPLCGIEVESSSGKFHRYVLADKLYASSVFDGIQATLVQAHGSDPSAKDVSRVLRVPGFFHQKDPSSPWLVRITGGTGARYSYEDIAKAFPPATYTPSVQVGGTGVILQIARVFAALSMINPELKGHYDQWISIGQALHDESDGGFEGLRLWDEWSQGKYMRNHSTYACATYQPGLCAEKWATFGKGRGININFIYKMAVSFGWDGGYYIGDGVDPRTQLVLKRDNPEHKRLVEMENSRVMLDFNEKHGFIGSEIGKVVTGFPGNSETVNAEYKYSSIETTKETNRTKRLPVCVPRGRNKPGYKVVSKSVCDVWRSFSGRKLFTGLTFHPEAGLVVDKNNYELVGEPDKYGRLNTYRGLAVTPTHPSNFTPTDMEYVDRIRQHIFEILCSSQVEIFNYVEKWFAHMLQYPARKPGTVLVFRSDEGTGKSIILSDLMRHIFGRYANTVTSEGDLTGEFNDHLVACVYLCLNEVVWGGNKKGLGTLKALITDKTMVCNGKFAPKYSVDNYLHITFSTNADWAAPVSLTDRRYGFAKVSNKMVGNTQYFNTLAEAIGETGAAAFAGHLLYSVDLTGFTPSRMPKAMDENKADNKLLGIDSVAQWAHEFIDTGFLPYVDATVMETSKSISTRGVNVYRLDLNSDNGKFRRAHRDDVYESYLEWTKRRGKKYTDSRNTFFRKLSKIIHRRETKLLNAKGQRRRVDIFDTREHMKKAFNKYCKQKMNWSDDVNIDDLL